MLMVNIKWKSYGKHIAQRLRHVRLLIKIITSSPIHFPSLPPLPLA